MSFSLMMGVWLVVSACQVPAMAQETATGGPAFRLVHAKNVEDLQRELDRASDAGYAVALAWPAYDLAILRRRAIAEARSAYRVLDGMPEIQLWLGKGYRAVPDTLDVSGEALFVIAVPPREGESYESFVLRTSGSDTLDREIRDAHAKGYRVIGMTSGGSGHAALLERPRGEPLASGSGAAAVIGAKRQETLQKELTDRAAAGYRIAQASSWTETALALERREGETPLEYVVLSTTKASTLEREMNVAAEKGFRFTPGTLHAQQKGAVPIFGGRTGTDYVAIMEKQSGAGPASGYAIVGARRIGTLVREFDEAVAKGLVPVALTLGYSDQETLVLFQRAAPAGTAQAPRQ